VYLSPNTSAAAAKTSALVILNPIALCGAIVAQRGGFFSFPQKLPTVILPQLLYF